MLDNKELHELAAGVMIETLYESIPQNAAGELAAGALRLLKEREYRDGIFNELLIDRYALTELRDFWRQRYNQVTNKGDR